MIATWTIISSLPPAVLGLSQPSTSRRNQLTRRRGLRRQGAAPIGGCAVRSCKRHVDRSCKRHVDRSCKRHVDRSCKPMGITCTTASSPATVRATHCRAFEAGAAWPFLFCGFCRTFRSFCPAYRHTIRGGQGQLMLRNRISPLSEMIRAVLLEYSTCCEGPAPVRSPTACPVARPPRRPAAEGWR